MSRYLSTLLIGLFIVTLGCAHISKTAEIEIRNDLLENLSRDLAEINLMVETARAENKIEDLKVKVIEPWKSATEKKFAISTPSERKEFWVLAKSEIEVPIRGGYTAVSLLKLQDKKEQFIGVLKPKMIGEVWGAFSQTTTAGKYPVRFYDPNLARDKESYEAITQYISITSRLEKIAKEILERLAEVKRKYEEKEIYIEGFSLSFPNISVQIQFKFKK